MGSAFSFHGICRDCVASAGDFAICCGQRRASISNRLLQRPLFPFDRAVLASFYAVFLGAVCAWLALSVYCALYPAAWVFFCWRMLPRPKPSAPAKFPELWKRLDALTWSGRQLWALAGAMGWASIEVLQAHLFTGFPWNFLAVSQVEMLPLIQLASWTGVYGVSFLVAWVSLSLGLAVAEIAARPGYPWVWGREILPAGLALAVVWIWGFSAFRTRPKRRIACALP